MSQDKLFSDLPVHLSPRLSAKAQAKGSGRGIVCNPLPSQEYLRECFDYEAESGLLRWRVRPVEHFSSLRSSRSWNCKYSGTLAGFYSGSGYVFVRVDSHQFAVSRVVLAWHGIDPGQLLVDHIDGNPSNNRVENLRVVTNRENSENRVEHRSGQCLPGVGRVFRRFRLRVVFGGVRFYLGAYDSPEVASAARAVFLSAIERGASLDAARDCAKSGASVQSEG